MLSDSLTLNEDWTEDAYEEEMPTLNELGAIIHSDQVPLEYKIRFREFGLERC